MESKIKLRLQAQIKAFSLPRYDTIPDVGLYLKQCAIFINGYLEPLAQNDITTSMISNYVKQSLIENPVKKLYYREQIAYLMFIAVIKPVVSLENIRTLFALKAEHYTTEKAYNYFCDEFENMLFSCFAISKVKESIGETNTAEKDILRNTIIASAHKIYQDMYLKEYNFSAEDTTEKVMKKK